MGHSYLLGGATAGMNVRIGAPSGHQPRPALVADAGKIAAGTGGSVLVTDDPAAAIEGADVVITDTWVSMGTEDEKDARVALFADYAITVEAFEQADPEAIVLHCLPAYRGMEIAAEVLDGPRSVVWDQAENRLHAQKALLVWLLAQAGEGS
jgi:ornithine carbamoyltransferase